MAMTAWSAKFVTSSICLSVNGRIELSCTGDDADRRVPSRSSGTPRSVRQPPIFCGLASQYSGSARTSGMWMILRSSTARPCTATSSRMRPGDLRRISVNSGGNP